MKQVGSAFPAKKVKGEKCDSVESIENLLEREVKEKTEREFIKNFCEAKTSIPTRSGKSMEEGKVNASWEKARKVSSNIWPKRKW